MEVALTVIQGPERGRVMKFHEPRGYVIGRARHADFRLSKADPYAGRWQVFLEICPPRCRVRDIGKTNEAHVNDEPFTERELADGDVLEIGYTQLQVSITAQVAPYIWRCGTCGRSIELLPGDPVPERCLACLEAERRVARAAPAPRPVRCASCRVDLTGRANSDGRAAELTDVVTYACEPCVPPGDEHAGETIGDYDIRRRLGEGGMGVVYLVYHRPTARILTLKQVKNLQDPLLIKRFEREIRLQHELSHRNIVRRLDTGIDAQGAPFLVTEYVPGGDLEDEVARWGGRLPVPCAVHLIAELLHGLEYLHAHAIIHRDLKPQNILLRPSVMAHPGMGWPTPKLADFGLAKSYARAGGTRLTQPGTGLGTLMFMPPEQVHDAGAVREPADLYAVGVTLYYLLTGQYSFNFPTPGEIRAFQQHHREVWKRPQDALRALMQLQRIMHPFQIILSEHPIPIAQRDPALPRTLAAVVDKAVRQDAQERFHSAAEFRSALQQALR